MMLLAPEEAARRVRAALAYAGVEQPAVVEQTNISRATLARIVSKSDPRGASIEELWQIADVCDVPRRFMEEGFAGPAALEERVARLEALLQLDEASKDLEDRGGQPGGRGHASGGTRPPARSDDQSPQVRRQGTQPGA